MSAENIPEWMSEKIGRLAKEKAARDGCSPAETVNTLAGEAFQTLEAELTAFPELSQAVPNRLSKNIRTGAFCALSAFELAAIVITDADAQRASIVAGPDDEKEFFAFKWKSIADLLGAEGGQDVD